MQFVFRRRRRKLAFKKSIMPLYGRMGYLYVV